MILRSSMKQFAQVLLKSAILYEPEDQLSRFHVVSSYVFTMLLDFSPLPFELIFWVYFIRGRFYCVRDCGAININLKLGR